MCIAGRTNASAATRVFMRAVEPGFEGFGGEGWDGALGRDAGEQLCDVAKEGELRREIHEAGSVRCGAGPEVDVAEGVGAAGADAAFIIMREEFGFVGGDVDADGAIAFASFAGQAEVEGFFHFFAAPAVANDRIFSWLAQFA